MRVECMLALIERRAIGVGALGDGVDRDPGFWLCDGGLAPKCRSMV
jgi:hypothetical protein